MARQSKVTEHVLVRRYWKAAGEWADATWASDGKPDPEAAKAAKARMKELEEQIGFKPTSIKRQSTIDSEAEKDGPWTVATWLLDEDNPTKNRTGRFDSVAEAEAYARSLPGVRGTDRIRAGTLAYEIERTR